MAYFEQKQGNMQLSFHQGIIVPNVLCVAVMVLKQELGHIAIFTRIVYYNIHNTVKYSAMLYKEE